MRIIVSLLMVVLILSALDDAVGRRYGSEGWKRFDLERMQINRVDIPITNYGEFGMSEAHTAGTYWPRGSGQPFIFGAGLWIGALVGDDTLVSCGYNTVGSGCDFCPGPPEHGQDHYNDPESHPEDRLYFSTDTLDFAEWPLRDSVGERISAVFRTPDRWADQEVWCEYHDMVGGFHEWEPGTYPLGIVVKQISFAWNSPIIWDMVFLLYEFRNVSDSTIRHMYVGHVADDDVGWADDDLLGCDIERSLGWTCTTVDEWGWSSQPPYYVGKTVLQGPKADDTVYIAVGPDEPGYPYVAGDTICPGEHIPLTCFCRFERNYPANTEWKRYMMLAGYNIRTREYDPWQGVIDLVPDDKRMVMGCGPFELAPGEVDSFFIAVMFSSGETGGLAYLRQQADIAREIRGTLVDLPEVRVVYPNGGEDLSGTVTILWESEKIDSIDLYLSPDSGRTWDILATDIQSTGDYEWNTEATPDGFYFLRACKYGSYVPICDRSDGEFLLDNPGNGCPQARVLTPRGGETLEGIAEIRWWARDPDGDELWVSLYYSNDSGYSLFPIAIGLVNSGSHSFNTHYFPNGTECLVRIEASDGVLVGCDDSDSTFTVFNLHEPACEAEHIAGGCNTVSVTPEVIREWEMVAHGYELRFGSYGIDIDAGKVFYTYDIHDLTSGTTPVRDHTLPLRVDGSSHVDCSPLFDGLSVRINAAVDSNTFVADSIAVVVGEYIGDLQVAEFFVAEGPELNYTSPECKRWAFRGEGTIRMEWMRARDTLRVRVVDAINNVEIPPDTAIGEGWCFGPHLPWLPPKTFLATNDLAMWFYISGVRYHFNGGSRMSTAGFASIDSGDVWILHNSGDRPPLPGDIYRFSPLGVDEEQTLYAGYFLLPNFPNPFSRSTTLRYHIPARMEVSLDIYDAAGRRVKHFVRRTEQPGLHRVSWNGESESGERVSQGIYFCRFSAGDFSSVRKLVLLR